ncbi:MAG: Mpo1-like protein, partial [Gemmatimonadales bacterium]
MRLGNRPMSEWVARYAESHQHPVNRLCHTFGIPMIALSLPLFLVAIVVPGFWPVPLALFVVGWVLQ